ncbi:MAG: hypothetical protein P8I38_10675 [Arenicella sp.]|jgi:hypothetical protein|nr:hypothetical protein [Arenicella sp.]
MRRVHRILGWLLCLPLLVWACTALVFLIKPGYSGAYHQLSVKTYALTAQDMQSVQYLPTSDNSWASLKLLRTKLGLHALKASTQSAYPRSTDDSEQNPPQLHWLYAPSTKTWVPTPAISAVQSRLLLEDAQTQWPERYGFDGAWLTDRQGVYRTATGVEMQLSWNSLSITQSGSDTQWINRLYRWHYLQWTGIDLVDRLLGIVGLGLLFAMTFVGFKLLPKP